MECPLSSILYSMDYHYYFWMVVSMQRIMGNVFICMPTTDPTVLSMKLLLMMKNGMYIMMTMNSSHHPFKVMMNSCPVVMGKYKVLYIPN